MYHFILLLSACLPPSRRETRVSCFFLSEQAGHSGDWGFTWNVRLKKVRGPQEEKEGKREREREQENNEKRERWKWNVFPLSQVHLHLYSLHRCKFYETLSWKLIGSREDICSSDRKRTRLSDLQMKHCFHKNITLECEREGGRRGAVDTTCTPSNM